MAVNLLPSSARYFNVCRVGTPAVAAVLASSWWLGVARVLWGNQKLLGDVRCGEDLGRL